MPQLIEVPGHGLVEFPDGMADADIVKAIKANTTKAAPVTATDRVIQGAIKDPINGGAQLLYNALPQTITDAGDRLNNWLADKTGLVAKVPARNSITGLVTGQKGGVNQMVQDDERAYQAGREAVGNEGFDWLRLGGNVISPVNMATGGLGAIGTGGRAIGLGENMLRGAATGVASGALSPVTNGGEDFAAEKAKQLLAGGAAGAAAPAVVRGVAAVVSPRASVNPNVALLRNEGVRPTVGQTLGGRWNALEEKLTSVPILGDAISAQRNRSLREFNQAAINRTQAPITQPGQGPMVNGVGQGAVAQAGDNLSAAYDDALNRAGQFVQDQTFRQELTGLRRLTQGMVPQMRERFRNIEQNLIGSRTSQAGGMTARTFKDVDSELGQLSSRYRGSQMASEQDLGDALAELQATVRRQMVRSNPAVAEDLARADEGWANLVRVEGAAKAAKNNEGVFTPAQLNMAAQTADRSVRKRAVARGEALMQDLGNAGQAVIGNKIPNSFTTDRALMATGVLGSGAINPMIPGAAIGGASLYTDPVQNLLTYMLTQRPQAAQEVANALRRGAPALAPAAAQVGANLLR